MEHRTGENRTTRNVIIAIAVIVLLILILFATGILGADTRGELEAPEVEVQGGEVPEVGLDTADIDVGTETVNTEVPEIDIDTTNVQTEVPDVDIEPAQ